MILFGVTLCILISLIKTELIPNTYCEDIADGIFLPSLDNCTDYYVCINNKPLRGNCPKTFLFNAEEQICDLPQRAKCFQCPKNMLKTYPLGKSCSKYILCFDGKPIIRRCLDGLQFNNETGRCDLAENLDCQENICSRTNNFKNIKLSASFTDCNKYYICYNGKPNPFYCAKGLHFNPLANECDLPKRARCPMKIKNRSIPPTNTLTILDSSVECPSTGSHFIEDLKHSDRYTYCLNGKSAVLLCSPGLIFDKVTNECRLPHKIRK